MSIKELWNKYIKVNKCSSLEEAKKQMKDRGMILAGGIAFIVVCALLGALIAPLEGLFSGIMMLGVFATVAGYILFTMAMMEKKRVSVVYCSKCGDKFDLSESECTYLHDRESSQSPDRNGNMNFKVVAVYEFTCTCSNCGESKTFQVSFDKVRGRKDRFGNIKNESHYDVDEAIKNYFD